MSGASELLLVRSVSNDPWRNLAVEERLMTLAAEQDVRILYLWQNAHTVVIGRHQNAWAECRAELLEQEGGKLARRTSGGGAVYHDLGNVNFSFVQPRALHDPAWSSSVILDAIKALDIEAELSGRNDILADGRKFSGNAFHLTEGAGLHHGTLLISSDFEKVARYLSVSKAKLQAKGVTSVRARITNLSAINSAVSVPDVFAPLEEAFRAACTRREPDVPFSIRREPDTSSFEDEKWVASHEKQQSWDWRFGRSTAFQSVLEDRFDWGSIQLDFRLEKGHVAECRVYTDMMDPDFPEQVETALTGIRYSVADLSEALTALQTDSSGAPYGIARPDMAADIRNLLYRQIV